MEYYVFEFLKERLKHSFGPLASKMIKYEMVWLILAIELDGKMWLTGGRTENDDYLRTTVLVSKNAVEAFIDLPNKRGGHCLMKINETVALLAGGWNRDTHFIDLETLEWYRGPDLPSVRFEAGCASFNHGDTSVAVMAGGNADESPRSDSVIYLDLNRSGLPSTFTVHPFAARWRYEFNFAISFIQLLFDRPQRSHLFSWTIFYSFKELLVKQKQNKLLNWPSSGYLETLMAEISNDNLWKSGPRLPVKMSALTLLPGPNTQGLLALGGYSGDENRASILHLDCSPGLSLERCQWKNYRKGMQIGRALHVAMYVPDTLNLCNE